MVCWIVNGVYTSTLAKRSWHHRIVQCNDSVSMEFWVLKRLMGMNIVSSLKVSLIPQNMRFIPGNAEEMELKLFFIYIVFVNMPGEPNVDLTIN